MLAAIEGIDCFDGVRLVDFEESLQAGSIQYIPDACLDAFVDAVLALRPGNDVSDLKLVYTPLNGTGLEPVKKLLAKMGISVLERDTEMRNVLTPSKRPSTVRCWKLPLMVQHM